MAPCWVVFVSFWVVPGVPCGWLWWLGVCGCCKMLPLPLRVCSLVFLELLGCPELACSAPLWAVWVRGAPLWAPPQEGEALACCGVRPWVTFCLPQGVGPCFKAGKPPQSPLLGPPKVPFAVNEARPTQRLSDQGSLGLPPLLLELQGNSLDHLQMAPEVHVSSAKNTSLCRPERGARTLGTRGQEAKGSGEMG